MTGPGKAECQNSRPCAQLLGEQVSLQRYWNYLRRQLYVMDTYVTPHNRLVNHTMLALHTYLSWAFVLPCLTGASPRTSVQRPTRPPGGSGSGMYAS